VNLLSSLSRWTGAPERGSASMVVGNRLVRSAGVGDWSINPRCEPWGLPENLEDGLGKRATLSDKKYFVESSFPLSPLPNPSPAVLYPRF
jgi:hypothetical protein